VPEFSRIFDKSKLLGCACTACNLTSYTTDMANPHIILSNSWRNQVIAIEVLLRKPFEVTKRMQEEVDLGNFFKNESICYVGCHNTSPAVCRKKIYVSAMLAVTTQVQQCVGKKSMTWCEAHLFKNNILLAAVYCNPQYRMKLTDNQQVSAREAFYDLSFTIHESVEDQQNDDIASVSSSLTNSDNADAINFDKHLDKLEIKSSVY